MRKSMLATLILSAVLSVQGAYEFSAITNSTAGSKVTSIVPDGYDIATLQNIYTVVQQIAPEWVKPASGETGTAYTAGSSLCTYEDVLYQCKRGYTTESNSNPPRRATINGREVRGELPADYLATLGYFPFESAPYPTEDAPEGKHWEERYAQGEGTVTSAWVAIDNPPPSVAPYDSDMESHLRSEREARGYTTREPDVYLNSQVPRWAQDARDWIAHRDAVMLYALDIINAVQSGEREPPTMEEFVEGLPKIEWTEDDNVEPDIG